MTQDRLRGERPPAPAKLRILAAADALFYNDGIHSVGVDRIIAEAKVTKSTFYKHFPAKELLIIAYVRGRDQGLRDFLTGQQSSLRDPALVLRALVGRIVTEANRPGFRGCPFINAAAQFSDPESPVRLAVAEQRRWYLSFIGSLLRKLGHPRPEEGAADLLLARDGALSGSSISDPMTVTSALRRSAERILAEAA
jgi:AcrR family transcriptional regulator